MLGNLPPPEDFADSAEEFYMEKPFSNRNDLKLGN